MDRKLPRSVVIQETHGNWAGMLRRQLTGGDINVIRVETFAELSQQLSASHQGCYAMTFDDETATEALVRLRELKAQFPGACFCGIVSATLPKTRSAMPDWPIFEAGASYVIRHPLEIPNFARLVRRYFAVHFCGEPLGGTEITPESVWLSLPWADHAR